MALKATALMLLTLVLVSPASAAKPQPAIPPFTLGLEQIQNNPWSPPWCLNEDDLEMRQWYGSFSGIFTFTSYFCTPGDGGFEFIDGGGVGISVTTKVLGTLDELSLSAPDGYYTPAFRHDAQWMGSETVGKGKNIKTYNYYAVCAFIFQPDISILTGNVTMTFRGSFSEVWMTHAAAMYPYGLQPGACP